MLKKDFTIRTLSVKLMPGKLSQVSQATLRIVGFRKSSSTLDTLLSSFLTVFRQGWKRWGIFQCRTFKTNSSFSSFGFLDVQQPLIGIYQIFATPSSMSKIWDHPVSDNKLSFFTGVQKHHPHKWLKASAWCRKVQRQQNTLKFNQVSTPQSKFTIFNSTLKEVTCVLVSC